MTANLPETWPADVLHLVAASSVIDLPTQRRQLAALNGGRPDPKESTPVTTVVKDQAAPRRHCQCTFCKGTAPETTHLPNGRRRRAFRGRDLIRRRDGSGCVTWRVVEARYSPGRRYPDTYVVEGWAVKLEDGTDHKVTREEAQRQHWPAVRTEETYVLVGVAK